MKLDSMQIKQPQSLSQELEDQDEIDIDFVEIMREAGMKLNGRQELELARKVASRAGRAQLAVKVLSRQAEQDTPERKLVFAVIAQSITDLSGNIKNNDTTDAINFWQTTRHEMLCHLCGLEPSFCLEVLKKMRVIKRESPIIKSIPEITS